MGGVSRCCVFNFSRFHQLRKQLMIEILAEFGNLKGFVNYTEAAKEGPQMNLYLLR